MFNVQQYREALDLLYRPRGLIRISMAQELLPFAPHLSKNQMRGLFEKAQFDNGGEAWLAIPGIRVSGAFHVLRLSHDRHRTLEVTAWRTSQQVPYAEEAFAFSEKTFGTSLETALPRHRTRTFTVADFDHPTTKGMLPGFPVSVYAGFDADVEAMVSESGFINANRFDKHLLYVVTSQTEAWELSGNTFDRSMRTTCCDGESPPILHCGHCGGGTGIGGCRHCGRTSRIFEKRAPSPAIAIPSKVREAMTEAGWRFATKRTPTRKFWMEDG